MWMHKLLLLIVLFSLGPTTASAQEILFGDVNRDAVVDGLDLTPLWNRITSNTYQIEADISPVGAPDGVLDLRTCPE